MFSLVDPLRGARSWLVLCAAVSLPALAQMAPDAAAGGVGHLGHHTVQGEARRFLSGRVVLEGAQELGYVGLGRHQ